MNNSLFINLTAISNSNCMLKIGNMKKQGILTFVLCIICYIRHINSYLRDNEVQLLKLSNLNL